MGRPASLLPRITFRLSEKLRDRLEAAAKANGTSLNGEIVDRLDMSFIHEAEGREADAASLRDEVMELRHGLVIMMTALANDDKRGLKEYLEGLLQDYRAEIDRIEREGKEARERHRQKLIERDGETGEEPPF